MATTRTVPRAKPSHSGQFIRNTRVPTVAFTHAAEAGRHVALMLAGLIRENNSAGATTVLGLPTGSTPIGVYRELVRLHRDEDLDFSNVVTFNLDEYFPMDPGSIHSYHRWMRANFFDHVNIPEENIHIPRGDIPAEEVEQFCEDYEQAIQRAGGIQLQLLGIGRTGHVGFNEPGSSRHSMTRMVSLDPQTRADAAGSFFSAESVPMQAVTMGISTILSAKKIVIMAFGEHKAKIVRKTVEEDVTSLVPATFLQEHPQDRKSVV